MHFRIARKMRRLSVQKSESAVGRSYGLAAGLYFLQALNFLSILQLRANIDLPNVDTALLAAFGLGQGAYLTVKAVSDK
jgi:hypothetical protein